VAADEAGDVATADEGSCMDETGSPGSNNASNAAGNTGDNLRDTHTFEEQDDSASSPAAAFGSPMPRPPPSPTPSQEPYSTSPYGRGLYQQNSFTRSWSSRSMSNDLN